MSITDGDEHQARIDRMIEEFRQARARRLAGAATMKGGGQAESPSALSAEQSEIHVQPAAAGSTATPIPQSNG